MERVTYRSAGVDIGKANALVADYKRFASRTKRGGILSGIGSFGALFRPAFRFYRDPILVSSTDGVGTKLKIAFLADRHDTVGIDLVAMSANDILCSGAAGLFFLDYIATGKVRSGVLRDVVRGIAIGCREAGYALVGGETAEMPGFYRDKEYDLAGFGVGMVDKKNLIDGSRISNGDAVIGLASSGLHSNGYSLVRKVFDSRQIRARSAELLEPTRIYCKAVLYLKNHLPVKGIAHITGGAFYDKIPRIIPRGKAMEIYKKTWRIPRIFLDIQKAGNIEDREMFRTLNMGIGMVVVVSKGDVDRAQSLLANNGVESYVIGKIVKGNREVIIRA